MVTFKAEGVLLNLFDFWMAQMWFYAHILGILGPFPRMTGKILGRTLAKKYRPF